jgi:cysteine synthase
MAELFPPSEIQMTPLIHVEGILAKVEWVHTTGSVKDRIARYILRRSEEKGLLGPGMRIVEASSGNTGIALAYHGREMGYPVTIVMPEHMSPERIEIIRALGAELILCSEGGSFAEAAAIRDEMAANDPNVFNPDQFSNPLNVECHRETTGQEIIEQAGFKIDAFVAGVGTGGTLIGVGQAIKQKWPDAVIVAVEPAEAAVMTGGPNGSHSIYGIGDGFIPAIAGDGKGGINELIDEVITVSSADALKAAKHLHEIHHLGSGTSSGANFVAAKRLQERYPVVATVFADGSLKYRSCGLRMCGEGECRFPQQCEKSILPSLVFK